MDESIYHYHLNQLRSNLHNEFGKRFKESEFKDLRNILITSSVLTPSLVLKCLVENIKEHFDLSKIDFMVEKKGINKFDDVGFDNIFPLSSYDVKGIKCSNILKNRYDIIIYFTEDSRYLYVEPNIVNLLKRISGKHFLMMDYNFKVYSNLLSKWVGPFIRLYKRNRLFYKGEPILFLKELGSTLRAGINLYFFKSNDKTFDSEKIKIMRDEKLEAFEGKNPFIEDRQKDKDKRQEIANKYLKDIIGE